VQLSDLQTTVDQWIRRNDDYWDQFQILARLTEEVEEIAAVLQRREGLRPRKVEVDLEGEMGDLLFTLDAFSNVTGIDLGRSIVKIIEKCDARDAQAWQQAQDI
jgi:NTP pyrophosphatase (non-canonical NTP hydrolase)